jgi:hypothetical protein
MGIMAATDVRMIVSESTYSCFLPYECFRKRSIGQKAAPQWGGVCIVHTPCEILHRGPLTVRTHISGTISHRSKSMSCAPCAPG